MIQDIEKVIRTRKSIRTYSKLFEGFTFFKLKCYTNAKKQQFRESQACSEHKTPIRFLASETN
jgi:hypothetical protein